MIELHKCAVLHRQNISRHLRVLEPYDPINIKLVIFDFSASDCIDFPELPAGKRGPPLAPMYWILPDFSMTLQFFFSETAAPSMFMRWVRMAEGQALVKKWLTFPEAFTAEEREPSWYTTSETGRKKAKL